MSSLTDGGTSKVDEILHNGDRRSARGLAAFGKGFAVVFNAWTTFLFGYLFVRLLPTEATLLGMSLGGLFGGCVSVLLTDGMARIWNKTQLMASESDTQHKIAKGAYYASTTVSLVMTGVYAMTWIAGATSEVGAGWVLLGRVIVTTVAMAQLMFWLAFERYSPRYQEELVRTTTAARLNNDVLDMKSTAIDDARRMAREKIAPYIEHIAEQIAQDAADAALAEMGYRPDQLRELPRLREVAGVSSPPPSQRIEPAQPVVLRPVLNGANGANGHRGQNGHGADFLG